MKSGYEPATKKPRHEKKKIDKQHTILSMDQDEFTRLTDIMFPKWSNDVSKIAKFMQNLEPTKVYNEKDIKSLCKQHGIVNIGQILKFKVGTNGYGDILKKLDNKTYQLYPELVDTFKYF